MGYFDEDVNTATAAELHDKGKQKTKIQDPIKEVKKINLPQILLDFKPLPTLYQKSGHF